MTQVISKIVLKIDPETLMDLKQACRQRAQIQRGKIGGKAHFHISPDTGAREARGRGSGGRADHGGWGGLADFMLVDRRARCL